MRSNHRGFTLVELMVTIAIAAILVAIAVPAFNRFVLQNRVRAVSGELSRSLWQARNHALTLGKTVSICGRSSGGGSCDASGSWSAGWITYVGTSTSSVSSSTTVTEVARSTSSVAVQTSTATVTFKPNGSTTSNQFNIVCSPNNSPVWRIITTQPNGSISTVDTYAAYTC